MTEITHEQATASRRRFLAGVIGATALSAGGEESSAETQVMTTNTRLFQFAGGSTGDWKVISMRAVIGEPLPLVDRLQVVNGPVAGKAQWVLEGVVSNLRYTTNAEKAELVLKQVALGRNEATQAALIPIKKSAKWWELTQDERRSIFEEQSRHTAIGLKYLPAIARRLHHCRDLAEAAPFDFLTFFDFAKQDTHAFDDLLAALRGSTEWTFVEREVDIRLEQIAS